MNIEFEQLPPDARVWVYSAERPLTQEEKSVIETDALDFTQNWTAHQVPLKASFRIINEIFLVFGVDVGHHDISGCGIDKSVQLVQKWEQKLGINLFNRLQLEYDDHQGKTQISSRSKLKEAFTDGEVNNETTFYNKAITNVHELNNNFKIPFKNSWVYSQIATQSV